jgi:hypothetical protein
VGSIPDKGYGLVALQINSATGSQDLLLCFADLRQVASRSRHATEKVQTAPAQSQSRGRFSHFDTPGGSLEQRPEKGDRAR